ncbi:MAG: carboxypeptidase regulatory-like domain-containing protein, partial [SAR324 cluster bacterium]|nr:carboxypeptidase regulatory-like domain-containing protein [SAR324 cluster bacterium]
MENFGFIFGIKNIRNVLITLATISIMMSSCQWEPPHSNPYDPVYESPSLQIQVKSLGIINQVAVEGATVQIEEHNLYATTDSTGTAFFEKIEPGSWMVVVFREGEQLPNYKIDSMLVTVNPGAPTTQSIHLDALPYFAYARVNVHSFEREHGEEPEREIQLKAKVIDADGDFDLSRVEWLFKDVSNVLDYNQDSDSAFHETIIADFPSQQFPYTLGDAELNDFYFEAFDQLGNSTTESAQISRVMNLYPSNYLAFELLLSWHYTWYDVFNDTTEFNFLLRIYTSDINNTLVYDTLLVPEDNLGETEHTIATPLQTGSYLYYIWVTDNYGNYVRSLPKSLVIRQTANQESYKPENYM